MIDPEQCTTMAEVRAGIDDLDAEIVALLGQRFRFVEAAGRVKRSRDEVRDERRISEVIQRVRKLAREAGVPEELVGRFYGQVIETAITIELQQFDTEK
jgi:isochorismate pyruvate lyase